MLSILGLSSNLSAQEIRRTDNGQILTIESAEPNFDELDVRQDPNTREYIFSERGFTELWAWLLFLEGRVGDLENDLISQKQATKNALGIADKALVQIDGLILKIKRLEGINIDLTIDNVRYKSRPNTFEVIVGGTAILIIGTAIGLVIGVVAE